MTKLVLFALLFGKRRGARPRDDQLTQPHRNPQPRIRWYS